MDRAAVIGDPVEHSRSPQIFGVIRPELLYERIRVLAENLGAFVEAGLPRYNVTLPHKETIIPYLDSLSPEAEEIGAVNVVHERRGYNTDYLGVIEALRGVNVENCLIYGAGGSARAVHYALKKMGAKKVFVYNRSKERARDLGIRVDDPSEVADRISLLVNTLPGVSLSLPPQLTKDAKGFDILYYTGKDPFPGIPTIGGMEMLIWQAIYAAEIWFGKIEDKEGLKKRIEWEIST